MRQMESEWGEPFTKGQTFVQVHVWAPNVQLKSDGDKFGIEQRYARVWREESGMTSESKT